MNAPVVYDTMVFLQAASRPHRSHASFQAIRDGRLGLCLSPELLAEIQDVFTRNIIRTKFPALTPEAVKVFVADLLVRGTMFDPIPRAFTLPQHPADDHLFNLAIHAQAKYFVTWETRLLELLKNSSPAAKLLRELAPNLSIVTPKELAEILKAAPTGAPTPPE